MNALAEYRNDTVSLGHINAIMSLISIMSTRFLVNSFILIPNVKMAPSKIQLLKMASDSYLKMNYDKFKNGSYQTKGENLGIIVFGKPGFNLSMVIDTKPKLIVAIYKMTKNVTPTELISDFVVPSSVFFFIVLMVQDQNFLPLYTSHNEKAKCFRVFRPTANLFPRIFPAMVYSGSDEPKWTWENNKTKWNSFQVGIRNMSGINITVALVTHRPKKATLRAFWMGKNSFFWRTLSEHLHFRCVVHIQSITAQEVGSITSVYIQLLKTIADGLGVLPVISSERDHHLDFILTGLDSKYHLLVRTPQYVYSWQSIFKPFALESWMCLGIAILLIIITLRIVTYYQDLLTDLSSCGIIVFGFLCFQGCPAIPKSLSSRLVCYTALIFSILIYQFYTSNFYSILSTKEVSLPFNSLEQFIAKRTHALSVHPDTAIYAYILKAENGTFKKLREEFFKKDPLHQLKTENREKSLSRVCKGVGAILGLPFQTLSMKEIQCTLVPVNSGYFPASIVTVVRKNFPFKSQFQFVHLRLLESGVSHKYRDVYLNLEKQHKTKTEVVNEPVSLEHVAFLFVFLAAAIILSWIILGIEIMYSKNFKSKKIKKRQYP